MTDKPAFVLLIHFFRGLFQIELFSVRDRMATLLSGILSLIASFGLMLPLLFNHKYHALNSLASPALYREAALADKLMFICISFVLTILVTALQWQSLFPSIQDHLILGPLPISRFKIFWTKFLALFFFICLLNIGIAVFPSAMMPTVMSGKWQMPQGTLMHFPALFLACCLAGLFAFFALVTLQSILLNLLPGRWFAASSLVLQAIFLLLALTALPLLLWIPNLHAYMNRPWSGAFFWPPLWFLGWEEQFLGLANPFAQSLAATAKLSLCAAIALSLALYALTYARNTNQLFFSSGARQSSRWRDALSSLLHRALSNRHELAVLSFTVKTLFRSRVHKMLLCAIFSLGLSLSFDSFSSLWIARAASHATIPKAALQNALLSTPLVISFFLLCGLRFLFMLPVDSRSNWTFQLAEIHTDDYAVNATEKALFLLAALPVLLITFCGYSLWLGPAAALERAAFLFLMCLLLSEGLLWNWDRIPFTCPYLPGKRNIIQSVILYGVALSCFAYFSSLIEIRALASPEATALLFAFLLMAFYFMRVHRRRNADRGVILKFDDLPEPEFQTLMGQPD